jgi:hypothetical protein
VVDHQIDRNQRVDLAGSPPRACRVAHRGQVDHGRNAGEILHQDAGRAKAISCSTEPLFSSQAAGH